MTERPIILFGGTGKFGQAFLQENPDVISPTHQEIDITKAQQVYEYIRDLNPAYVIHAAAVVGRREAELDRIYTFEVNVDGTHHVAKACLDGSARLVYLSSVAVFDGNKGMYKEGDVPNPAYYYGWTKLLGEQAVKMLDDYTIVRTDFFVPGKSKYKQAFIDHFCSRIPVQKLVRIITQLITSNYQGIINVGGERDTLFNILKPYIPDIEGIKIADSTMPDFPADYSLDISLCKKLFPEAEYQNGK